MKKTSTNESYSSPRIELLAMACEQAVMSGSFSSVGGATNEAFEDGGSFTEWI